MSRAVVKSPIPVVEFIATPHVFIRRSIFVEINPYVSEGRDDELAMFEDIFTVVMLKLGCPVRMIN